MLKSVKNLIETDIINEYDIFINYIIQNLQENMNIFLK